MTSTGFYPGAYADRLGDALRMQHSFSLGSNLKISRTPVIIQTEDEEDKQTPIREQMREILEQGWRPAYLTLFGSKFVASMAPHHQEAVQWHFDSRLGFLKIAERTIDLEKQIESGELTKETFEALLADFVKRYKPEYLSYFPIWSRGHMKTTMAEHIAVVDGVMSATYRQPGFCLFIGREKDKVKENIGNIEALLTLPSVMKYAPELSRVAKNDETNSNSRWTATFLHTQAGYVYKAGSIVSTQAGSRVNTTRPTLIIFDDIDGREESEAISKSRFNRMTGEIIPMRQWNTLIFFAQNLINRYSTMYRIYTQSEKALTNRKPTQPIPAVRNLVTQQITVDGIIKDVYVSGEPTWHIWDADRINDEIGSEGLPAFLRECQHEVAQDRRGLMHKAYNDDVHPISHSQFAALFGSRDTWKDWYKVLGNDWARTKTKYHANVGGYLAVSSANTAYPGLTFCIPKSFEENSHAADVAAKFLEMLTPYANRNNGHSITWTDLIDQAWKRTNANRHFKTVAERIEYERNYYSKLIPQYSRPILQAYRVGAAVMSHSEDKVRELFNDGFGFDFEPSNPGKTDALEDIDEAMRVDYNLPHLFDPQKKGYTRWYVLCEDDLAAESYILNGTEVYPPKAYPEASTPDHLHDDELFRYQMCNRRFREPKLTATGETIDTPEKLNDDFGQWLQMIYLKDLLKNIRLTSDEKKELHLAPKFRMSSIKANAEQMTEQEYSQALVTRQVQLQLPKVLNGGNKPKSRFSKFKR